MAGIVIDTATPVPGAALKAAGVTCVFRYLSSIHGPKIATQAEVADLHANGIAIGLVYEDTINDMGAGLDGGIQHGKVAVYEAATLGAPAGTCIYFACDSNSVEPNTRDTLAAVTFIARHYGYRAGWYGRADVGRIAIATGLVDFVWAVDTWPGGNDPSNVAVFQRANHPQFGVIGIATDFDEAEMPDFGQWAA